MPRFIVLAFLALILPLSCGVLGGDSGERTRPTTRPTETPAPTPFVTSTPRPTLAPLIAPRPSTGGSQRRLNTPPPTRAPTATPVAKSESQARNLVWAYLNQCVTFEPSDLTAVLVREDWLIRVPQDLGQGYGIWKVRSISGILEPFDAGARAWQAAVDADCEATGLSALLLPTPTFTPSPTATPTPTPTPTRTPTPVPTATPVLRSSSDAISTLWAYLVKCFPTLTTSNLEATLDPPAGEYVVKDKGDAEYGVWRVKRSDGRISPDNSLARSRDQTVRSGVC